MFPLINKQARRGVTIPDLAGGVNYRDGITEVLDNQLTDCKNMWFKDGALRTRPAVYTNDDRMKTIGRPLGGEDYRTRVFENIKNTIDGKEYVLHAAERRTLAVDEDGNAIETTDIFFYWVGADGVQAIDKSDTEGNTSGCLSVGDNVTYCVTLQGSVLYCFVSNYGIYFNNLKLPDEGWVRAAIGTPYVPTVYTHCKETGASGMSFEGTQFEGFNLLSPFYKMIYSTVNPDGVSREMRYAFPETLPMYDGSEKDEEIKNWLGKKVDENGDTVVDENGAAVYNEIYIRATHTFIGADGFVHTVNHDVVWTFENTTVWETKWEAPDGLCLAVNPHYVMLWDMKNKDHIVKTDETLLDGDNRAYYIPNSLKDNLEIQAISFPRNSDRDKVFSMTRAEWFGGAAEGLNGGSRLFLCGNAKEDEKHLVMYSDLNRPLYFSENSYFYVGDATSAVTGFGKQADMLVVFKENETYFTKYNTRDITAEELINQSVIDYAASKVYFLLTLIHSSIGCDLPDTVKLCRNRLVWATKDGKVYTLTSDNQYSERNIFEVGEMINRKTDLCGAAVACDWGGYYVLLCRNRAFLMDYNSGGYQYVYSYQKNEDANVRIPWYVFEFDFADNEKFTGAKVCAVDGALTVSGVYEGEKYDDVRFVSFKMTGDTDTVIVETGDGMTLQSRPVSCAFTTKLFNFGAANYRKNVDSVGLSLGANGGIPIGVTFITDCGENTEFVTLYSGERENYTAGHIQSVVLNPSIRSVIRFGVRLSCDGVMSVDGATVNYRLLGPAR